MPIRAGALGYFGDARRAAIGSMLVERVVETGSLVIRKLGGTRAGEIAIHRFLSAPSVTCGEMVETLAPRTAAACHGRRIVAAQDTTEINFAGREARRRGLAVQSLTVVIQPTAERQGTSYGTISSRQRHNDGGGPSSDTA